MFCEGNLKIKQKVSWLNELKELPPFKLKSRTKRNTNCLFGLRGWKGWEEGRKKTNNKANHRPNYFKRKKGGKNGFWLGAFCIQVGCHFVYCLHLCRARLAEGGGWLKKRWCGRIEWEGNVDNFGWDESRGNFDKNQRKWIKLEGKMIIWGFGIG